MLEVGLMAALSLLTEGSLCGFSFAVQPAATIRMTKVNSFIGEPDNARDHRAGTSDHPLQKHTQVRLRVHHIVIRRFLLFAIIGCDRIGRLS